MVVKRGIDKTCEHLVAKLKEAAKPVKGREDIKVRTPCHAHGTGRPGHRGRGNNGATCRSQRALTCGPPLHTWCTRGACAQNVASISAGNDEAIGEMIASALDKVGSNGVLSIESSNSTETFVEVQEGMEIDRGYISPQFVTNQERLLTEYDNCRVLVTDQKIESIRDIVPILEQVRLEGREGGARGTCAAPASQSRRCAADERPAGRLEGRRTQWCAP